MKPGNRFMHSVIRILGVSVMVLIPTMPHLRSGLWQMRRHCLYANRASYDLQMISKRFFCMQICFLRRDDRNDRAQRLD